MRHYVTNKSYADESMKVAMGCLAVILIGSAAVSIPIVVYENNQTKNSIARLNAKVERDLGVDSFNANGVIFDSTNENYFIKIAGSSREASYVTAKYKVNEQDFYNIRPKDSEFVKEKDMRHKFVQNLLDVIYRSEFFGKDAEDLALAGDGEIVLNLSKPYLNEETGLVNYNLTIAELNNKDLKLGTYIVSVPMSEEIMQNPESIYSLSNDEVQIEKVDEQSYKDVMHVEMCDDCTLVM